MVQGYVFIDVINPPAPCVITTASQVSVGKTGRTASTTTSADHTYSWAIFPGGLITGGAATANMTYTAPGSPMMLDVRCRSTNGANDFVDTTEVVDVIPLPSQCSVSMATQVTVSRQNLPATANAQPGVTFNWGVSCGAITSGQGTTQLRYTACGSPGMFDVSCQACNGAGDCATTFTQTPTANPTGMELMFGAIGSSGRVDGLSSGGASRLNVPRGMAVARTTGTIAIAESGNQCVRLISGNFSLSTLPGIDCTPGSQTLNSPVGVAIRSVGVTRETYIADNLGQTIWKQVDNGAATIIAGASGATGTANSATGTSARFNFPADLSIDERNDADPSNDVLYIADNANHAIRKMSLVAPYAVSNAIGAPGTAGTNYGTAGLPVTGASARLTNPTALAMSRDNLTLYAAEVNDEAIAASLIGSVFLMQIYKSPPVLGSYRHAAYDFEGRLWLTATAADQIRDAAGVATSIGSGTGTPMTLPAALGGNFDAPDGIVVDPWTGDLYVSSSTQHVIVRVRH
ncbi:MAG: hypothetical protein IT381_16860 [Deltaproteobacteria bacterium]|nr:hypothetical protein [Deltaproteobacteria bacterium]